MNKFIIYFYSYERDISGFFFDKGLYLIPFPEKAVMFDSKSEAVNMADHWLNVNEKVSNINFKYIIFPYEQIN